MLISHIKSKEKERGGEGRRDRGERGEEEGRRGSGEDRLDITQLVTWLLILRRGREGVIIVYMRGLRSLHTFRF